MKTSYYENSRERDLNLLVRRDGNYKYDQHYHINVEILIVKSGRYRLICNGNEYDVCAGSVAFIDSYDIHGYGVTGEESTNDALVIIPFTFLERFNSFRNKMKVACPIINDGELVDKLLIIVENFLNDGCAREVKYSAVDLILSLVEQKLTYSKNGSGEDTVLIKKILQYIEKNFKEDVSVQTIARALGYTKEHISRTFNKCLKQGLPAYVNKLRLQYIENDKSKKTLNELIYESGFNSVPTYYRCKNQYK